MPRDRSPNPTRGFEVRAEACVPRPGQGLWPALRVERFPAANRPPQQNRYQGLHRCDRGTLASIMQNRGGSRGDGDFVAGEQY